jgi:hypothetical protein
MTQTTAVGHTPGPWIAREYFSGHWDVAADASGEKLAAVAKSGANARLIAAAPDMLEALRGIVRDMETAAENQVPIRYKVPDYLRAAIAKATGQ